MRVFIAIEFNSEVKAYLDEVKLQAKALADGGSFTHKDNLHLTLKFIGEVEEKALADIKAAIKASVMGEGSFYLTTSQLGTFSKKNKNILWVGLKGELNRLNSLFEKLEFALEKVGINKDERGYNPHITLGRQVVIKNLGAVKDNIRLREMEIIVEGITLMESKREDGRLEYRPLYSCKLD